jgi:signal recognition particle GTPase
MAHRKTHRRKHQVKRKTRHNSHKNRTRRHRKGGRAMQQNRMNINIPNNANNEFEDRLGDLINELQDIVDSINIDVQKEHYIDQILTKLDEARAINQYFGNEDMEQQIAQRIADVLVQYDPNTRNREISEAEFGQIINQARRNYINQ